MATDGSRKGPAKLGAFGWPVVQGTEAGGEAKAVYGSTPGVWRLLTVFRSELFAMLQLLQRAAPPTRVRVGNGTVVKGLARRREWCVRASRPHADLWRQIRGLLDETFPALEGFTAVKVKARVAAKHAGGEVQRRPQHAGDKEGEGRG